jgi:hypothetical protein
LFWTSDVVRKSEKLISLILQAFVLKCILFFLDELKDSVSMPHNWDPSTKLKTQTVPSNNFSSLTEDVKIR